MTERAFRQSVVGVFVNDDGKVLVGERSDAPGSWQLPQGGVDDGESVDGALRREMREELGIDGFQVVRAGLHKCRYEFPPDLAAPVARRFRGQEQTWFLLRIDPDSPPDLARGDGEFSAIRWEDPAIVLSGIIDWKRACYVDGFRSIGINVR